MVNSDLIHNEKVSLVDSIGYFIFYLIIGLMPHIYRYIEFTPSESEKIYFKDPAYADLYMLGKSKMLLCLTAVLIVVFAYQLINKRYSFIKDKITIWTGVFAGGIVLSSLMSEYQDLVYWGAKDRFEGMWVWFAYLVIFTIARHYGKNSKFVKKILEVYVFSASIMAFIGVMQVFGYDIYTQGPLRWLSFPSGMARDMGSYLVTNTTNILAVGALYNSNYFGVYCSIAIIIGLYMYTQKDKGSVLYALLIALNYVAMIASRSEAALLGFAVAVFVFIVFNYKKIKENISKLGFLLPLIIIADRGMVMALTGAQSNNAKYIYVFMIVLLLVGVILALMFKRYPEISVLIKKYSLLFSGSLVLLAALGFNVIFSMIPTTENYRFFDDLRINANTMVVKLSDDEQLKFEFLPTGLNVYNSNEELLVIDEISENFIKVTSSNRVYQMKTMIYSNGYLVTMTSPFEINIFYDGEKVQYVNPASSVTELEYPERMNFYFDKGHAFSKRGYIWGTYIPVIKDKIIFGNGLGSYIFLFPQSDFIGKHIFFNGYDTSILIDKPHSLYLMVGLSLGGLGLIMLIFLIIAVVERGLSNIDNIEKYVGLVSSLTVIFISGIFNDSVIPITLCMFSFSGLMLISDTE